MKPKLSQRTISALQRVISGNEAKADEPISPYRSGPDLVEFFNELGSNDSYSWGGGFPSRWMYAEGKLEELNETDQMVAAIEMSVDPAFYLDSDFEVQDVVDFLNQYLDFDGFRLVAVGKAFKLRPSSEQSVSVEARLEPQQYVSHEFIAEQLLKCDQKIAAEDFDGAITNARSVVEAVMCDLESRLDPDPPGFDGELMRLFKRVQKLLNLEPDRPDISESLKQLLRGLTSVVGGLAPLRNKMSDAHIRTYKPARHHAKLAVNSAKSLLEFLYDTFEYQKSRGDISEVEKRG